MFPSPLTLEQVLSLSHSIMKWEKLPKEIKFVPHGEICFEYEKKISYHGYQDDLHLLAQYQLLKGSWVDDDYVRGEPMVIKHYHSYRREYYALLVFQSEKEICRYSNHAFPHDQIEYTPEAKRRYRERIQEVYKTARRKAFFQKFMKMLPKT